MERKVEFAIFANFDFRPFRTLENPNFICAYKGEVVAENLAAKLSCSDMLVEYLYHNGKRYKQILWFCYGKYVADNLKENVEDQGTRFVQCVDCGKWVEIILKDSRTCRCQECDRKYKKMLKNLAYRRYRDKISSDQKSSKMTAISG